MCKVGNIILIDKYKHGTNCKVIEVRLKDFLLWKVENKN